MGNENVLAYFWDLASLDQTLRVKAVVGLILEVKKDTSKVLSGHYSNSQC